MIPKLLSLALLTIISSNGNEISNHSYVHNVGIYNAVDQTITDEDGEVYGVYAPDVPNDSVVLVTYDTMETATRIDDQVIDLEIIE